MRYLNLIVKASPERRRQVYDHICNLSTPSFSFYVLVAISTVIAAYGLLANSTAVVIGAMLVAPLMGPIFGTALGLLSGDRKLFLHAAASVMYGLLLAIFVGLLIGLMPLRLDYGPEIQARIRPTLYDIIIALASGVAGAYALVDEKVSPALPGVAIATALVPPLTTCGLCLATLRWEWAAGAFLLFLANLLAIQIAAATVFAIFGMTTLHTAVETRHRSLFWRFAPSLALLIAIGIFMTHTLLEVIEENRFRQSVEDTLANDLRFTTGAQLSEIRTEEQNGQYSVMATVLTPQEFTPIQVGKAERSLRQSVHPRINLVIRSLISRDADSKGPVFLADEDRARRKEVETQTRFLQNASRILSEGLGKIVGAQLIDLKREQRGDELLLTAVVQTPTAIEPDQVSALQETLEGEVREPVHLVIRSLLTRDADSQRYLYVPEEEPQPLTGTALAFHRRLEAALGNQLRAVVPGATLKEFRYREQDGRLLVLAVTRTPRSFTPAETRRLESILRFYTHPRIALVVRSEVGADTASVGYLSGFDEAKVTPHTKTGGSE